ncbi:pyocin knob domain-containing protein [Glutamicibacter sp. X7]
MAIATSVVEVADLTGPAGTTEANAKFDSLEATKFVRGTMPLGTNVNNLRVPGLYIVPSQTYAESMVNLPVVYPGVFLVYAYNDSSVIVAKQTYTTYGNARGEEYVRVSTGSTTWRGWEDKGADYGIAPAGLDLDTLGQGKIGVQAPNHTTIVNGPPGAGPGIIMTDVSRQFTIMKVQRYYEYGGTGGQGGLVWVRTSDSFTTYGPWKDITATGGGTGIDYAVENPWANEQRKQWFIRRRGGFIGTGGMAAVAIRIDHGAVNMRDLVLNELVARSLPWGMAINPAQSRLDLPENAGVTWSDYNDWARIKGMEPWNHSYSHSNAETTSAFMQQIVGGRDLLQQNMPSSAIEGWMVPGVGAGGYLGQSSTNQIDSFFAYEAGRIIMSSHAVSSGYGGGDIRPQVGALVDGQDHYGLDGATDASVVVAMIQQAQDTGGLVQLFLHPSQIGLTDKTTVSVLNQVWDYLAAERDAGRLMILSPSGLLLADPSKESRANLLRFSDFQPLAGRVWSTTWENTTGWTQGAGGVSTSTGGVLTQLVPEHAIKHARGALYEVIAEVSSTGGAMARIGSTTLAGATKDITVPAGQTLTIRQHVTIPLDSSADFNVSIGRVSGADLTVKTVALQPV